jgi:PAS domain S-box-containing protein
VQASWEAEWDGKVTLDSPSWRAFTGQSYEEWKDYGWVKAGHPDDRPYAERQWRDAVAVRRMVNAEFRLWHVKSGSWRWTNVRAVPLLGETGEAEKWIGINLDTPDCKVAEEAVRKREALWSLALRTLPVGIALVDPGGETVMANDQMRRFLPSGRIPSRDPARVGRWKGMNPDGSWVAPQDFPGARALRGEVVMPGLQMIYDDEQGGETWTEVLSAPLLDEEGAVTAAFVVVVDVDRIKRSEEAALRSEERLRQFGDASQDILWIRDATSLQWQYLTPAFETVYGLSREIALTGDNYRSWLDLVVPEDRAGAQAAIERVRHGEYVTFDYRIRRPADGSIRWLRNTDFPIRSSDGEVKLLGGVGHDLTEHREIELRLQTLIEGIPQLVWRAIDGGDWTWSSPQWTEMTGLTQQQTAGFGWLSVVHPDDRDAARGSWDEAMSRGTLGMECRILDKKSGELPLVSHSRHTCARCRRQHHRMAGNLDRHP